ncbi:MAG TPA: hypothetical protein VFC33_08295, partial [Acidimicrobiia bacterium]|nr:hypothetical protein [Acidimicrobiia bacterium]
WSLGGAPLLPSPYFGRDEARGLVLTSNGGYELTRTGAIVPFGGAPGVAVATWIISPPYARQLAMAP